MQKTNHHQKLINLFPIYILISLCSLINSYQLCSSASSNCLICLNQFNCFHCASGFYALSNGTQTHCEACQLGCFTCTGSICARCSRGWDLNINVFKCQCREKKGINLNTLTCNTCTTTFCFNCKQNHQICTQCIKPYGLSNNTCIPCTTINCQICHDADICLSCSGSLGLSSGQCISCIDPNCLSCKSNANVCNQCINGYGLGSTFCQPCTISSCEICNTNYNNCDSCLAPLGVQGSICATCADANCAHCNRNSNKCLACSLGYGFDLDLPALGLCFPCLIPHCQNCQNIKICAQCQIGYQFRDGFCTNCLTSYCVQCDGMTIGCPLCAIGYGNIDFMTCATCSKYGCISCGVDYQTCNKCASGLGYDPGTDSCVTCIDQNCVECGSDYTICEGCANQKGLSAANKCQPCTVLGCASCPKGTGICAQCYDSFGINPLGHCVPCNIPHCLKCSTNYMACSLCMNGYGRVGRRCQSCYNDLAYQCHSSITIINYCIEGYGINYQGNCVPCQVDNCNTCDATSTKCTYCNSNYGVQASTGQCLACSDPNCFICGSSFTICTLCKAGHFNNQTSCVQSAVDYCSNCFFDVLVCASCIDGYGLDNGVCSPCPSNCLFCSIASTCLVCNQDFGLDTNNLCGVCPTQCLVCDNNNVDICVTCADNFYLDGDTCSACPIHCITCSPFFGLSANQFQCFSCSDYFQLNITTFPQSCSQICGDSWVADHQCDLPMGVQWDGCNDQCEVEADFECESLSNQSVCSFKNTLSFNFVSISRINEQTNELQLIVGVFPPLFMFQNSNLLPVFSLSPSVNVTGVTYDKVKNQLIFRANFDPSFAKQKQLQVFFVPSNQTDMRYFASIESNQTLLMPNSNEEKFVYFDSSKLLITQLLNLSALIIVIIAWISLWLGLFLRKLAGIEAIMTIQFIYLSVLWLNGPLSSPFSKLLLLKYSSGFYYPFFGSSTEITSLEAPFASQFSLCTNSFINNFNLMFIFQLIPIVSLMIAHLRKKKFEHSNNDLDFSENFPEQKLECINRHREYSLQSLLYFTMLNLLNGLNCIVIFLKSPSASQIISILSLTTFLCTTLLTFFKFFSDPDPFDFFRYSFRIAHQQILRSLCFNHCLVLSFTLSFSFLLMSLLTSFSFLPLVPLLTVLVYSLIMRPYELFRQNLRSSFNLLVLCVVILFRIILNFGSSPFLGQTISYPLIVITFSILPLAVVLWAFLSLIYELIRKICYSEIENQINNEPFNLLKHSRNQMLFKLERTEVRKKMKEIHENTNSSIFKRITNPQANLLDYSNALFEEVLQTQKQLMKDIKKSPIDLQKLYQNGKSNKLNVTVEKLGEHKVIRSNKYTIELEKIISDNQNHQKQTHLINSSPLAKQVLANQNKFVQYKGSIEYIERKVIKLESPNKNIYLQIYDNMGEKDIAQKQQHNQNGSKIQIS